MALQDVVMPAGTIKIGESEYDVRTNGTPRTVEQIASLPIKQVPGTTIYLRDLASIAPSNLRMAPLADQSIFVRAAVSGVIREAVIAAALTGLMILLFLGSWRSTLIIAVSIPLSIRTSVIVLSFLGETINTMTLDIERYLEEGRDLRDAITEGASQISVPALVSTLCICIVFLPMFFLGGVARYLFVPLAEAAGRSAARDDARGRDDGGIRALQDDAAVRWDGSTSAVDGVISYPSASVPGDRSQSRAASVCASPA
jgi:multidrug efflux pump subunit AcrB